MCCRFLGLGWSLAGAADVLVLLCKGIDLVAGVVEEPAAPMMVEMISYRQSTLQEIRVHLQCVVVFWESDDQMVLQIYFVGYQKSVLQV